MSDSDKGAAAKAQEVKQAIAKLAWRDRVTFLGSAALVVLFLLPWYRASWEILGDKKSDSWSGLSGSGWLGFLLACCAVVVGLVNMGFIPLSADLKAHARKTIVQLGVSAAALFVGPIRFLSSNHGWGNSTLNPWIRSEQGHTLFFWLALLVALAATGAVAWKFIDEQKAKAPAA